jgi:hypothetical protein
MSATSSVKRIDPAAVAAWFRAHPGVEPVRGRFSAFDIVGSPAATTNRILVGCCGLITQAIEAGAGTPTSRCEIARALGGLDPRYIAGFMDGWDDADPLAGRETPDYERGIADGRAAYVATMAARRAGGAS